MYNRFQVKFLGSEDGKSVAHPEPALVPENADGTRSSTVFFPHAFIQHALK
jgi:hypothetical protein